MGRGCANHVVRFYSCVYTPAYTAVLKSCGASGVAARLLPYYHGALLVRWQKANIAGWHEVLSCRLSTGVTQLSTAFTQGLFPFEKACPPPDDKDAYWPRMNKYEPTDAHRSIERQFHFASYLSIIQHYRSALLADWRLASCRF